MFDIKEQLNNLPARPGVYIMRDKNDVVIYVGKAVNLRNRVRNYFQPASSAILKVRGILKNIDKLEYIVTDNEMEALILEANLIKKYMPRYNVLLKDDKHYPYIKITVNEEYPRIFVTRQMEKDGAKYYGPYTNVMAVNETIELLRSIWPLRSCSRKISEGIQVGRPCLNKHINLCSAPCTGTVLRQEYLQKVEEIENFLNGKHTDIVQQLSKQMLAASEQLEFEKAADYRDKIEAIRRITEKQKIDTITGGDQDVIAFARNETDALMQVFIFRDGKMSGREHFMMSGTGDMAEQEIMTAFVTQFYSGTPFIPKELILQCDINDGELIGEWLSSERKGKVHITVPQRGEKLKLVRLAQSNALITLSQFGDRIKREQQRTSGALEELRKVIGVDCSMERIEAYDISNTQGIESVGSMIVFENGKPKNSDYRKFKIKTVIGANDFASMEEVLTRRFNRYFKEREQHAGDKAKFSKLPDIIFMDGGKVQVNAAEGVLEKFGLEIPVCGMVKDDRHRTRGLYYRGEEINLDPHSEGFKLLTRIQDEVHRFAIEYHRKLRGNKQVKSVLDDIKGVGAVRRRALLRHFKTIDAIRTAEVDELAALPEMNQAAAEAVFGFFHSK